MDLKLDEMAVDTSLAREYIEKGEFSTMFKDYEELKTFVYQHEACYDRKHKEHIMEKEPRQVLGLTKKLNDLAKDIILNANLIAQLEYVIRKIPIEDTKTQINIISNFLMCYAPAVELSTILESYEVKVPVCSEDPLLIFGNIKRILFSPWVTFIATKATAHVAQLFVKLCHRSGLSDIRLEFTDDADLPLKTEKDWDSGTVAILSEDADIDSAVDKLIPTSKLAPWRLRKILVQESVYQQFKDALTWKCNLNKKRSDTVASKTLCSEILMYDGKIFVIDPVGLIGDQHTVTVEAYRTRKEMISMVQEAAPHYLSLWSNGIAEINEVTYKTEAPIVWVNNLAEFGGPSQISQAVYGHMFDELKIKCGESVLELRAENWRKLSFEDRRITLNRVLAKSDKFISKEVADNIRDSLAECSMKSFVHTGDGYVCVGTSSPVGTILISFNTIYTPKTFKSLLYGNTIIDFGFPMKKRGFEEELLPIASINQVNKDDSGVPVHSVFDCRFRAVWTNSGTIFAN